MRTLVSLFSCEWNRMHFPFVHKWWALIGFHSTGPAAAGWHFQSKLVAMLEMVSLSISGEYPILVRNLTELALPGSVLP